MTFRSPVPAEFDGNGTFFARKRNPAVMERIGVNLALICTDPTGAHASMIAILTLTVTAEVEGSSPVVPPYQHNMLSYGSDILFFSYLEIPS